MSKHHDTARTTWEEPTPDVEGSPEPFMVPCPCGWQVGIGADGSVSCDSCGLTMRDRGTEEATIEAWNARFERRKARRPFNSWPGNLR